MAEMDAYLVKNSTVERGWLDQNIPKSSVGGPKNPYREALICVFPRIPGILFIGKAIQVTVLANSWGEHREV